LLLPVSLVLYVMGRVIDMEQRRLRYRALKQGTYVGYMIIVVVMLYLVSAWVIGQIYFWQLLAYSLIAIVFGYGISLFSGMLMKHAIKKSRMKGKRVINDIGASIGKVIDIDQKRGSMLIKTDYGNTITYDIDRISSVSDRIIVR
jgi:sporulation protein YlmC with PRC-barrel domain